MSSPLGRYSDLAAAVVAILLVFAAVAVHLGLAILPALGYSVAGSDTAWIDTSAVLALGVILGQRATTNGAAKVAALANARLDAIHAPAGHELPTPGNGGTA